MARLGGLSSEAFSPPAGLGSILRDQKVLPGVRSNRANVVLGIARPPVTQSVSVSSSPKDSYLLDVAIADESDDLKEEDIWGMEDAPDGTVPNTDFETHTMSAAEEFSLGVSPKRRPNYAAEELALGIGSPKGDNMSKVMPARRRDKAFAGADVFVSNGSVGHSLLSRTSDTSPLSGRTRIPRRPSASRMIPISGAASPRRHAEGQSAPVEVPKWSKMMARRNERLGLMDDDKDGKDDDDDRLPPHELLARESSRSQRTTFSVCEGLGRTLKGRDLSRVRNAVWSQMGFAD